MLWRVGSVERMCSIQLLDDSFRHLFIFPVATGIGKDPDAGKD